MYTSPNKERHDLFLKTLSWVRLNFELQSILSQSHLAITIEIKEKLCKIGYAGKDVSSLCPQERKKLFDEEGFFSCIKTGNRIVAFILKENGLNKEAFKDIEENISNAYHEIKKSNGANRLVDKSYAYTLESLAVFRP